MENEREPQAGRMAPQILTLNIPNLVLASTSPRRAEILRSVGWEFEQRSVDVDETYVAGEDAVEYVKRLSRDKAQAAAQLSHGSVVLGADTTVVIDKDVLGKPRDSDDAREMLRRLAGRWHFVYTGVTLMRDGDNPKCEVAHEATRVLFAPMTDEEINWYVGTGEPMGKAGAYAIQGRAGLFVEKIEGDYWNIVGLPVSLVYRLARRF
jgi:septum formation protein